jgi:hypothetical protein
MILKLAYSENSTKLVQDLKDYLVNYPLLKFEMYDEQTMSGRKKAFGLKSEWGAKLAPFAILIDDEKDKPVLGFYSENNGCTFEKIINALTNYIIY